MLLEELKTFRLAGGTALSLRLGHRISIDLDFFTNQIFEVSDFSNLLKRVFFNRLTINGTNRYGVFTTIDNVKVDFLYRYEKFINEVDLFEHIRLASFQDIAAMKFQAAANRGARKDYYDLYELLNVFTFDEVISFFKTLYTNYDTAGILRSLTSFSEAENDEEPDYLKPIDWGSVKERLTLEIRAYIQMLRQAKISTEIERQKNIEHIIKRKKKND